MWCVCVCVCVCVCWGGGGGSLPSRSYITPQQAAHHTRAACVTAPLQVTDDMLLAAMNNHGPISSHDHYDSRTKKKSLTDRKLKHNQFRVHHYAGDVIYSVDGFIDKNRDTLWTDISRFLHNSSVPMVSELFQSDGALEEGKSAGAGKRPTTLGSQFRASIAALMTSLSSKNPHYIRFVRGWTCAAVHAVCARGACSLRSLRHRFLHSHHSLVSIPGLTL
jgi:hypothetical protein